MAAEARAMLDALMGTERNEVLPSSTSDSMRRRAKSCYDRDICPLYCAWGIDVYELFTNTKSDLGPNPRKVSNEAREEYLSLPEEERDRLGYEYMLYNKLLDLVRGCDRIVNRNKEKLRQEISRAAKARGGTHGQKIDPVTDVTEEALLEAAEVVAQLEIYEEEVKASLNKIMSLDTEWKSSWAELNALKKETLKNYEEKTALDESDHVSSETAQNVETIDSEHLSESIDDKMKVVKSKLYSISSDQQKAIGLLANLTSGKIVPLRDQLNNMTRELYYVKTDMSNDKMVCEVSGNFMSSRDADERIAAHYAGKQYVGWKMVREKVKELDPKYRNYRMPPPPPSAPYGDGGYDRGGYYEYGRGRGSGDSGYRGGGPDSRNYDRSRSRDDRWERHGPQGHSRSGYGGGYRRDFDADRRRY